MSVQARLHAGAVTLAIVAFLVSALTVCAAYGDPLPPPPKLRDNPRPVVKPAAKTVVKAPPKVVAASQPVIKTPVVKAVAVEVPASAPATQPSVIVTVREPVAPNAIVAWLNAWWPLVVLVVGLLLVSLRNALTKYTPKATGVITAINILIDVLAFWGNKDSPTGANVPLRRSRPPAGPPPVPTDAPPAEG